MLFECLNEETVCHPACGVADDELLLADIQYTMAQLRKAIVQSRSLLTELWQDCAVSPKHGLIANAHSVSGLFCRQDELIPLRVIKKIGSTAFAKRRPQDTTAYHRYVTGRYEQQQPLLFRVGFGPVKNVNLCGNAQDPDCAEYLSLIQLLRLMRDVVQIYPYGVRVQIVPDDLRGAKANRSPVGYTDRYIAGLRAMVRRMGATGFLDVEQGQQRLYNLYEVPSYYAQAEECLKQSRYHDPVGFEARWNTALMNALRNLPQDEGMKTSMVEAAAWEYLTLQKAEVLSGLWLPTDAFPLRYAHHADSYQLYTIGFKKTKLPWQIALPMTLLTPQCRWS